MNKSNSSWFKKGHAPWNMGLTKGTSKRWNEVCRKISEAKRGKPTNLSELQRIARRMRDKGKTYEEMYGIEKALVLRKNRSLKMKKYCEQPEVRNRRKQRMLNRWKENPEQFIGKNNGNWQGGISFEPYLPEFNNELKLEIRKRDDSICQFCGSTIGYSDGRKHPIHHIDYDKQNNQKGNLVTLCNVHNVMAGSNKNKWELCFAILNEIRRI